MFCQAPSGVWQLILLHAEELSIRSTCGGPLVRPDVPGRAATIRVRSLAVSEAMCLIGTSDVGHCSVSEIQTPGFEIAAITRLPKVNWGDVERCYFARQCTMSIKAPSWVSHTSVHNGPSLAIQDNVSSLCRLLFELLVARDG